MKIEVSSNINVNYFTKVFDELCRVNNITKSGRARLTYFRAGEGAYQPTTNQGSYVIEMIPIDQNNFELNSEGFNC